MSRDAADRLLSEIDSLLQPGQPTHDPWVSKDAMRWEPAPEGVTDHPDPPPRADPVTAWILAMTGLTEAARAQRERSLREMHGALRNARTQQAVPPPANWTGWQDLIGELTRQFDERAARQRALRLRRTRGTGPADSRGLDGRRRPGRAREAVITGRSSRPADGLRTALENGWALLPPADPRMEEELRTWRPPQARSGPRPDRVFLDEPADWRVPEDAEPPRSDQGLDGHRWATLQAQIAAQVFVPARTASLIFIVGV